MSGVVQESIVHKLTEGLAPSELSVENESHMHNVPAGSESHFKVIAVAAAFEGKRPVQRHQAVYALLAKELASDVHALALHLYTSEEWQSAHSAPESPPCLGGSKAAG